MKASAGLAVAVVLALGGAGYLAWGAANTGPNYTGAEIKALEQSTDIDCDASMRAIRT